VSITTSVRAYCLDRRGDLAAIDMRHAEIRDHHGKRSAFRMRLDEGFDACLSAIGADDFVAIGLERVTQRLQQQRIVVDDENAQRRGRRRLRAARPRRRGRRDREAHAHQCALAEFAFDVQAGTVTLGNAVNHREPESGAACALRREERFEAAPPRVFIHADALVLHLEQHDL
jgi:hypothetical protein